MGKFGMKYAWGIANNNLKAKIYYCMTEIHIILMDSQQFWFYGRGLNSLVSVLGRCDHGSPCEQLCYELHDGMYECDCKTGFILRPDGYSCYGKPT